MWSWYWPMIVLIIELVRFPVEASVSDSFDWEKERLWRIINMIWCHWPQYAIMLGFCPLHSIRMQLNFIFILSSSLSYSFNTKCIRKWVLKIHINSFKTNSNYTKKKIIKIDWQMANHFLFCSRAKLGFCSGAFSDLIERWTHANEQ